MTGTVIRVIREKGFGFILDEEGTSRFFGVPTMACAQEFDEVREGTPVTFTPAEGPKGLRAVDVKVTA
jgi:cold shock CspA family protein